MTQTTRSAFEMNKKRKLPTTDQGDKEEKFCLFGGLQDDTVDVVLYEDFVFEVCLLMPLMDTSSQKMHDRGFDLGRKIYEMATTDNSGNYVGNGNLAFRVCFQPHNVITRLSMALLDCTAFASNAGMVKLRQLFEQLFPELLRCDGIKKRLITTGKLRAVLMGLAKQLCAKQNIYGKSHYQISNMSKLEDHTKYILDFAQLAQYIDFVWPTSLGLIQYWRPLPLVKNLVYFGHFWQINGQCKGVLL